VIIFCQTTGLASLKDYGAVLEAVRNLAQLGKFAQYTRYTEPGGSGIQTTLWKAKESKLRLDLQRVFSTGAAKVSKAETFWVKGKRVAKEEYDAAQKKPLKQRPSTNVTEETVTTYDTSKIWSLFSVQEADSYNQVFVINSPTYNPSVDQWVNLFENSLRNVCAAMVTTERNNLPEGFTAYDIIAGAGDIPGDFDPTT
jgi:hypothetical protein